MLQTKKNTCSCSKCLEGIFTECLNEVGSEIQVKSVSNKNENDRDYEDNDYEEYDKDDNEQYELRADVISILAISCVIAFFSP